MKQQQLQAILTCQTSPLIDLIQNTCHNDSSQNLLLAQCLIGHLDNKFKYQQLA
jgi:hypothetical protein